MATTRKKTTATKRTYRLSSSSARKRTASRSVAPASDRSAQEQKYRAAMKIARASVMWMDKYAPYDLNDALEVGESRRSGMNRIIKDEADMIMKNKDNLVRTFTEWLPDLDGQAAKD